MLQDLPILSLITLLPAAGAVLLLLLPLRRPTWIRASALVLTVIPLLLTLLLYVDYQPIVGGQAYAEQHTWLSIPLNAELLGGGAASYQLNFDYNLGVDGLSLPLMLLTGIVSVAAVLGSVHIRKRWKTYYPLILLLQTGMYGVFLARDLTLFFLFFEATLVPMFFLIGIWGDYGRERAANRFLLFNGLGSAFMLAAFLLLIATLGFSADGASGGAIITYSGSYDVLMAHLNDPSAAAHLAQTDNAVYLSPAMERIAFLLLLIAFGIKMPIVPFHTWMLRVHAEAPPSVVMIHAGILLKMGVYGLIRFGGFLLPDQLAAWAPLLAALGVVNVLYGGILACVQKDFRLMLAYSSVSHMGIALLGIAALNEIGLQGAVYQSVSHGLIAALLFLIVGTLLERTGTTKLAELGGLARAVPFLSGMLLLAGLASLGLPGLSGFVGELLSLLGLFGTMKALTILGMLGILLAAVYMLRGTLGITFGALPESLIGIRDARFAEALPMVGLAAFILLLGVYPSLLTDLMQHGFDGLLHNISKKGG